MTGESGGFGGAISSGAQALTPLVQALVSRPIQDPFAGNSGSTAPQQSSMQGVDPKTLADILRKFGGAFEGTSEQSPNIGSNPQWGSLPYSPTPANGQQPTNNIMSWFGK